MKPVSMIALVAIALSLLCGCTTVYLEQETPAGNVAPLRTVPPPTLEQGLQDSYKAVATSTASNSSAVVDGYRAAYLKAKQPRIAVYLNRALSAEIREWKADERLVANERIKGQKTLNGSVEKTGDDGNEKTDTRRNKNLAAEGEYSISHQTLLEDATRTPAGENWAWAFEDGFSQPLLEAGTKLIDRATIMRLTAADMVKNGDLQAQLPVRQVETMSLKGYADLLVEILVTRSAGDTAEYDYKVAVKDIQTGQLLANTTTLYPGAALARSTSYKATANGFQAQGDDPYQSGQRLAQEVMFNLTKTWSR